MPVCRCKINPFLAAVTACRTIKVRFVLRQGKRFEGGKTYWTIVHLKWLKTLELSALQRETLDEYLLTYEYLTEKNQQI